jgi:hypothetical protein
LCYPEISYQKKAPILNAYVDSISGDTARILIGDEGVAISVPLYLLPPGTRQGVVLRLRFTVDQAATNARGNAPKQR